MRKCSRIGCDRFHVALDLCQIHYDEHRSYQRRGIRKNKKLESPLTDVKRFWDKVEMSDGCWTWRGARFSGTDRGQFKAQGKTHKAYRFSYEIIKGEIPQGLTIDHLCRNPNCVNPWHLEAITQRENNLRVPRDQFCSRGHQRIAGTRRCDICSKEVSALRKRRYKLAKESAHEFSLETRSIGK